MKSPNFAGIFSIVLEIQRLIPNFVVANIDYRMIKLLTFIGLGSFLGGIARYGVGRLAATLCGAPTLWGTFAANVGGCFLIGLLYGLFDRFGGVGEHWRLFLTVGFCGGFTTFSTFAHENYSRISEGRFIEMAVYATLSFALGLLMVHLGHLAAAPRPS